MRIEKSMKQVEGVVTYSVGSAHIPFMTTTTILRRTLNDVPLPSTRQQHPGLSAAAAGIVAFHSRAGRLPLSSNPDEGLDYGRLRSVRERFRNGKLSAADKLALDAVPRALKVTRKDPLPILAELEIWCASNERLPRHSIRSTQRADTGADKETALGQWMYRHVNRRHNPLETPETAHIRNSILRLRGTWPKYSGSTVDRVARQVLVFIDHKERLPDHLREQEFAESAHQILAQHSVGDQMGPHTSRLLHAVTGDRGYLIDDLTVVLQDELEEFVMRFGCLPENQTASGPWSVEARLAQWVEGEVGAESLIAEKMARAA